MSLLTTQPDKIFMRTGDLDGPVRRWVIGDSHSLFFAGLESLTGEKLTVQKPHEGYRVYYVGPGLASSLVKPVSRNRTREKVFMALDDIKKTGGPKKVLFSFGEIDCRFHIRQRAQKAGQDNFEGWKKSAGESVGNYSCFLQDVSRMGFDPVIWGPPPSTPQPNAGKHDWLTLGTPQERNTLTREVNGLLEMEAARHGFGYISLFEALMEGLDPIPSFSEDGIHIAQRHWPLWLKAAAARLPKI
jgi:hypothetical protein